MQFKATGFFRLEQADRWWLVTPEGNAFLSFGISHIQPDRTTAPYIGVPVDAEMPAFYPGVLEKAKQDLALLGMTPFGCHTPPFYGDRFFFQLDNSKASTASRASSTNGIGSGITKSATNSPTASTKSCHDRSRLKNPSSPRRGSVSGASFMPEAYQKLPRLRAHLRWTHGPQGGVYGAVSCYG